MTGNGEPLQVDTLEIRRAPGFQSDGIPLEDLSPGINVIYGPNASGKTTIAHSIQAVLWPETGSDHTSLVGHLSRNGDEWRVEVSPTRVAYQRNGQEDTGPNLPPADQRDRYFLALHDLLQETTKNESFAQRIQRESVGGYDITAAHDTLEFDDSASTRGTSAYKDARKALDDWGEATAEIETLREEKRRLTELEGKLAEVRAAQKRETLLEQAIECAVARNDLKTARKEYSSFPSVLADVTGDEYERVSELIAKIDEHERTIEEAQAERSEAKRTRADTGLPADGLPDGFIATLKDRRETLASLESEKRTLERQLAEARETREMAATDIPLEVDSSDLTDFEPPEWQTVEQFARQAQQVEAQEQLKQAVDDWLDQDDTPTVDKPQLNRGQQALEDWLAHPASEGAERGPSQFHLTAVASVLLAGFGVVAGLLVNPVFIAAVPIAAGLLWYGNRLQTSATMDPGREQARRSFEKTGIQQPETWTETAVRKRLFDIYSSLATYKLDEQRKQQRKATQPAREELEEKKTKLETLRANLQEALGAEAETPTVELLATTKGILRWQAAHEDVLGYEKQLETLTKQRDTTRSEITEAIEPYDCESITDSEAVTGVIRELERRQKNYETATESIERARERIEAANEAIDTLETKRREIYDVLELEVGDLERLRELCDQVSEYEAAVNEFEKADHLLEKELGSLTTLPGFEPELLEANITELRRMRGETAQKAEAYDRIQEEKTAIETKIEAAKRDTSVETALAQKDRKLAALAEQLEDDYDAMVGDVLTDHLEAVTRESSRPAVFDRATELLAKITRGRYRLDLDLEADTFRAYDETKGKGFALGELSSGTRLQVLLAVRIAFVETQEQGMQLPLLLDETLANTDDGKARIIIDSMIELARDGRQVFYFTAQGDEVAKWEAALESASVPSSVIDLGVKRNHENDIHIPDLETLGSSLPSPPEPGGMTHEEYGDELDVPPFDPREGAGRTHLWYLVDDVSVLYELLSVRIDQWGKLKNVLAHSSGAFISADDETVASIQQTGRAIETFVDVWQVGRGKQVDRQALEETEAVTSNFIDEVDELATMCGGDAEEMLAALRAGAVKGFREDKKDELERYFEKHGYIDPIEPLEPEEIRVRVIERLIDEGLSQAAATDECEELLKRLGDSQ